MRIPITKDGIGVLAVSTAILALVGALGMLLTPWVWVPLAIIWLWAVSFFRDPNRDLPRQQNVLYAPADGKVTTVIQQDHHDIIGGPCICIRIFLSIFNVHINRMPCAATVTAVHHAPGKFLNAMRADSAELNESITLVLSPAAPFHDPLVLRQIVGMIARTIVCHARVSDRLAAGERFGMIKFGSGTELVIPQQEGLNILASVGDTVKAGITELARLDPEKTTSCES